MQINYGSPGSPTCDFSEGKRRSPCQNGRNVAAHKFWIIIKAIRRNKVYYKRAFFNFSRVFWILFWKFLVYVILPLLF